MDSITEGSLNLFLALAKDAPNWSGAPLVDVSRAERGNLTQLKRAGLVTSFVDGGDTFVDFTQSGKELAAQHGFPIAS